MGSGGWTAVVSVGNNGTLYYDSLPPGGSWSGWTQISGSSSVTGVPMIIQDKESNDRAFVRSVANTNMMEAVGTAGTSNWSSLINLGGIWPTDATALTGGGGQIWLFTVGVNSDVDLDTLPDNGTTWTGWTSVGGGFTGVPAVIEDNSQYFRLFGVTTGGTLEENSQLSGGHPWTGWITLGSSLATS